MKLMIRSLLALSVAALLGLTPQGVLGQAGQIGQQPDLGQPEQSQEEPSDPAADVAEASEEDLILEGEIQSVDVEAMTITLLGEDGMEMQFTYDAQTEVVGQPEGVQGLTGEAGAWAKISYHPVEETAVAHRIELVDRSESGIAPDASPETEGLESPEGGSPDLVVPDDGLGAPEEGSGLPVEPGPDPDIN